MLSAPAHATGEYFPDSCENRSVSASPAPQKRCWYAPIDAEDRRIIRTAFDHGNTTLTIGGEWTLLRAFHPDSYLSLQDVQTYADTLPKRFPPLIDGKPRYDYRKSSSESF